MDLQLRGVRECRGADDIAGPHRIITQTSFDIAGREAGGRSMRALSSTTWARPPGMAVPAAAIEDQEQAQHDRLRHQARARCRKARTEGGIQAVAAWSHDLRIDQGQQGGPTPRHPAVRRAGWRGCGPSVAGRISQRAGSFIHHLRGRGPVPSHMVGTRGAVPAARPAGAWRVAAGRLPAPGLPPAPEPGSFSTRTLPCRVWRPSDR